MNFSILLQDLIAGKINEIEVNENDFFSFNQAWLACPQHKQIIGTAQRDGKVNYHFVKDGNA